MRWLLDTHIFIWALSDPQRLDRLTRSVLDDPGNDILFSTITILEIAIKTRLGRIRFDQGPMGLVREARRIGFRDLAVTSEAAALVAELPLHHRDPFDRLLVAQAIAGETRLLTADQVVARYSDLVTLVR